MNTRRASSKYIEKRKELYFDGQILEEANIGDIDKNKIN